MIKLRIKLGAAELEIEGDAEGLHTILERHWEPHVQAFLTSPPYSLSDEREENGEIETSSVAHPKKKKSARGKPNSTKSGTSNSSPESEAAASSLANKIKNSTNFAAVSSSLIVGNAPLLERCKLVLNEATEPLTSGEVLRALLKLGIRTDASAVSKALSNNKVQFITSGNPIKYEMTAHTKAEFAKKLSKKDGE